MQAFNQPPMRTISSALEKVLSSEVGRAGATPSRQLAHAVATLSQWFTTDRTSRPARYLDDPLLAAAYRTYFMPVNAAKIQALLDELPDESLAGHEQAGAMTVLDVGSGPGTGALACLDWMVRKKQEGRICVLSVDSSQGAVREAMTLWDNYCRDTGVSASALESRVGDLENIHRGPIWHTIRDRAPYDLIVMANCLNELFTELETPWAPRAALVAELLSLLRPHGTVMLLEPALKQVTRALHHVRDHLLRQRFCTVYSPCLHDGDCPALTRKDDWCHEERPWLPPSAIREIDQEVGFIKDALKFSYLLLRKDGRTIVERKSNVFRVVSELREMKGEKRAWLCNETGRSEVGRLDRLASPQNAAVDEWHRGAIVQIERIVRKEKDGKVSVLGRIERDAIVQIVRPV